MNNFLKGVLFGVGVGLLIAPLRGEETRKLIGERVGELRGYIPENEQLNVYKQQITDQVSQTAGTLKDYAQQASTTVKSSANSLSTVAQNTASNLSDIAQNAASTVKTTGANVADTTRNTLNSTKTTNNL